LRQNPLWALCVGYNEPLPLPDWMQQ